MFLWRWHPRAEVSLVRYAFGILVLVVLILLALVMPRVLLRREEGMVGYSIYDALRDHLGENAEARRCHDVTSVLCGPRPDGLPGSGGRCYAVGMSECLRA